MTCNHDGIKLTWGDTWVCGRCGHAEGKHCRIVHLRGIISEVPRTRRSLLTATHDMDEHAAIARRIIAGWPDWKQKAWLGI